MGRLASALWGSSESSATAEIVHLPPISGDVAQVAHLPVGIQEAFGIYGAGSDVVSREQAMQIPAMRRGRQVIAGTLGAAPLIAIRRRAGKPPERLDLTLLRQPDPSVTRAFTMTWTLDDLIFYGVSWWQVLERGSDGFPIRAERVAPYRVAVDYTTGKVRINGQPVADRDIIRFDGPDEGVLKHGGRALRTAILLEDAVRNFARLDIPLGFFQAEDGTSRKPEEVAEFLNAWEAARKARSTGYVDGGLKYVNPNFNPEQLQLSQARQHQAGEIARLLNLPPSAVNAPTNDSLTYATTESNRRELVDLTFAGFSAAVEQRLSMPDVTPLGTEVRVDLSRFIRGDLTSVLNAAKTAIDAGLMTADEIRADWLDLPPLPDTKEASDGSDQEGD